LAETTVHYAAAGASDRGRKRANNEDAYGYSLEHGIFVVCDGMGGAAAGEVASRLAVDEVLREVAAREAGTELVRAAENGISAANRTIIKRAERNKALQGMGTTLVALAVEQNRAWVLNVGDSRCYRLRGEKLEQLTLDHSLVDEQVRRGRMSRRDAERSPLRNVITRAVGTTACVLPDLFEFETQPGDLFLLCSDGLTRELADALIQQVLETGGPLERRVGRLVDAANQTGGQDNITCVLVEARG
jgi:protein phosphatase